MLTTHNFDCNSNSNSKPNTVNTEYTESIYLLLLLVLLLIRELQKKLLPITLSMATFRQNTGKRKWIFIKQIIYVSKISFWANKTLNFEIEMEKDIIIKVRDVLLKKLHILNLMNFWKMVSTIFIK